MTAETVEPTFFDKRDQLEQILPFILPTEQLFGVFDLRGGGTGFIAVTDLRLILYDKAFLGKKKALTSVPYRQITTVSSVDQGGLFRSSSELVVKTGTEVFVFEFHGGEKAHRAYGLIMASLLRD